MNALITLCKSHSTNSTPKTEGDRTTFNNAISAAESRNETFTSSDIVAYTEAYNTLESARQTYVTSGARPTEGFPFDMTFFVVNPYFDVDVTGWTHNPFLLVTSPLGISEDIDCLYEWEITFAWTVEMDRIYEQDQYICVNVSAETMTPGGKVTCRPTHIFLTKELFTRTGNYGYYSFRFQSRNGAGNRERLHIWSDGYIAISGIQCEYKPVTERRTEILTQQIDVRNYKEF
jgi:hypothetical protein